MYFLPTLLIESIVLLSSKQLNKAIVTITTLCQFQHNQNNVTYHRTHEKVGDTNIMICEV